MPRIARAVLTGVAYHSLGADLTVRKPSSTTAIVRGLLDHSPMQRAAPGNTESLARSFGEARGRYAAYANAKLGRSTLDRALSGTQSSTSTNG